MRQLIFIRKNKFKKERKVDQSPPICMSSLTLGGRGSKVSRLQQLHPSRYDFSGASRGRGAVRVTRANLAQLMERTGKGRGGIIQAGVCA